MVDPNRKINNLTDEHREFLVECEMEFADRYTERDVEFMELYNRDPTAPPIVEPWYSKPRRNFDFTNRRGRGGNQYRGGWQHSNRGGPSSGDNRPGNNYYYNYDNQERGDYNRGGGRWHNRNQERSDFRQRPKNVRD